MPPAIAIVLLGLLLGMRHATDPDHVVAVTTIVSREQKAFHAAIIGGLWGLGHTATIVLVGSAIILLKVTIPPALGLTMELAVACTLILLGALNLSGILARVAAWLAARGYLGREHSHVLLGRRIMHAHGSGSGDAFARVEEVEAVRYAWMPQWSRTLGGFHVLRPLVVGIVHGLAGSAAVALLVLTTIRDARWAVAYLLVFGIGTIIGMMLITSAIAFPFTYTMAHFARLNRGLAIASGVISLSFGLFLCYRVGVSGGLFTGHPNWVPR